MDALRTDRPILDSIGAYRLLKHLRANGPVQVYLAHEEGPARPSRDVVLKIVSKLADEDAKKIEELRREATVFSKLSHPAIVRTYGFFAHENSLVFALEHVDGVSLAELLATKVPKGGRLLSDEAVFHVAISLFDALAYAHRMCDQQGRSAPVVHKGVSPSKVRVARDGTVKLGGFGLAKPFGVTLDRKRKVQWESAYMAPEQVLEGRSSSKVDVYAAGLLLWELLTGRSSAIVVPGDPFAMETAMRALAERTLDPLATLRPDLPRDLTAAVDAALVSSPEKRTIGCAELAQEIRKHARVGRGKEELRARVQSALSAVESRPPRQAPGEEPPKATRAVEARGVDARRPTSNVPSNGSPVQPPRKQPTLLGLAPLASQGGTATRKPPVPLPPPPSHGAPAEAVSRTPPSPAAAGAREPIQPTPVVTIDSPSHAAPLPLPPAQPPKVIPSPEPDAHLGEPETGAVSAATLVNTVATSPEPAVPPAPSPIDSVTGSTMEVPASTERRPEGLLPTLSAELERSGGEHAITPGDRSTAAFPLSSILQRFRAPTRWRRSTWLTTWVGLTLGLASLIAGLAVGRSSSSTRNAAQTATTLAIADVRTTLPVAPDTPPEQRAPAAPPAQGRVAPVRPSAKPTPSTPVAAFSMALMKRHLGHLTVHSFASYARVYMMFTRYGRVEERLTVPCGQRFIAIGLPARGPQREPVWLAPGKLMQIPCGGSLEVTMNPRRVR